VKNDRYAIFSQSTLDFPCFVELGKNKPTFGINRWGNYACSQASLRFVPPDDEGFAVRGNKRQLLYNGRRRSHRFTVHEDTSFEYDCILLREPESNMVCLRMEGAEKFDFFRQPDFVRDPFLKGSYAVYKKETLIGEGTGKLCHIHRPLIIDVLGRRCWGELAVVGNELQITIPVDWLASAKYPVTVDPVIGTNTIGSQFEIGEYDDGWDEWIYYDLMIEGSIAVNRFLVNDKIDGICTAYFYTNYDDKSGDLGTRGVLFSDNNNVPQNRKSKQENFIDISISASKPKGWRSGTFSTMEVINSGSYIWFGGFSDFCWYPRFDYGAKSYFGFWFDDYNSVPDVFPLKNKNLFQDFKFSMYFTYTANITRTLTQGVSLTDNRNEKIEFKRTVIQETKLTDTRNIKAEYKRISAQTTNINDTQSLKADYKRISAEITDITDNQCFKADYKRTSEQTLDILDNQLKKADYIRKLMQPIDVNDKKLLKTEYKRTSAQILDVTDDKNLTAEYKRENFENVNVLTLVNNILSFFRKCIDSIGNIDSLLRLPSFFRFVNDDAKINSVNIESRDIKRTFKVVAENTDIGNRSLGSFRSVLDSVSGIDDFSFSVLFVRSVRDTQGITDAFSQIRHFIRCLYVEAGNVAETARWGDYYRTERDTALADGAVFRYMIIFIKLVSTCFVRDFIIRRFLIAREEIILRSKITLELTIESKIN